MIYATLILPLALSELYHYRLPEPSLLGEAVVRPGMRVIAPLGPKRFYTGIVHSLTSALPESISPTKVKTIESALDDEPLIDASTLQLWEFLAHYYQCSLGQVMRAALPGGLLPESQTEVMLDGDYLAKGTHSHTELAVLEALAAEECGRLTMGQLRLRLGRGCPAAITQLIARGAIYTEERLTERYRPKRTTYIGIADEFGDEAGLRRAEQLLHRAPKQLELLYELVEQLSDSAEGLGGMVKRATLTQGDSRRQNLLRQLEGRGILRQEEREEPRLSSALPPMQALEVVPQASFSSPVGLLYTRRSDSREAYILGQIKRVLSEGRQVLLLTPTPTVGAASNDFLQRVQAIAEGKAWAYHSLLGEHLRSELYLSLARSSQPCVIVGTRAAVLLPLRHLGLIIVDEEQEYLYKQQFTAPLYHARDVALWLGHTRGVQVLLTSETPSAEALFNTLRHKYELLTVSEPEQPSFSVPINIINLDSEQSAGRLPYGQSVSWTLREQIEQTLARGQRVLLLQNRRGYAPCIYCWHCKERIPCPHCSVSLTYHSQRRSMHCHYCAYEQPRPTSCPSCGEHEVEKPWGRIPALSLIGHGVERVEEEVQGLFPERRVLRIDSDSLQSRRQLAELEARLEADDVDIIVGTQLIKGQPVWERIGLVGVINLDAMIGFPDFRAQERAYQLLRQLQLRLGGQGDIQMCIQTRQDEHPFLLSLERGDYRTFIKGQLAERREELNLFPPFCRLTYIKLRAFDEALVERTAIHLAQILRQLLPGRVSSSQNLSVTKIDNQYLRQITCRRPYHEAFPAERIAFSTALNQLRSSMPESSRVRILFDIDPL
ncbi:MAG: primosomal protein N' [Porphyromonadaceae bacterium]|nr:primosomal protein N' [Porphyromonadaceae bacterium]